MKNIVWFVLVVLAILSLASIGETEYRKKTDPKRKEESVNCIYPPQHGVYFPDEIVAPGMGCRRGVRE